MLVLLPYDVANLQIVCKKLRVICRDHALWREHCFLGAGYLEYLQRQLERTHIDTHDGSQSPGVRETTQEHRESQASQRHERKRLLANWDPSYANERVSWYDEYISRHAPVQLSWLQQPRDLVDTRHDFIEIRGLSIHHPFVEVGASQAVAPLADGSICLWDLHGQQGRKGRIIGRSKPGLLSLTTNRDGGSNVNSNTTDIITIDHTLRRAYLAVDASLVEIDLETLRIISQASFPSSVTALSEAKHPTPISVGTQQSLELYDARIPCVRTLEPQEILSPSPLHMGLYSATRESKARYASLHQLSPLSILHEPDSDAGMMDGSQIYVAGRFTSILNYDRRYFPKLRGTIHSGAQLCGLAWISSPFSTLNAELSRRGQLSIEQMQEYKSRPGKTLLACGEYRSKGSLEIYGLSTTAESQSRTASASSGQWQTSTLKNRQSSSSSKLLSISNHGLKIVVSDGGGRIKWFERDGTTEVRRLNLAFESASAPVDIFGTIRDEYMTADHGGIARKIMPTQQGFHLNSSNNDNLAIWTGEKIGLLGFSAEPGFTADSFDVDLGRSVEDAMRDAREEEYAATFRRALEDQANEVRYVRGLGFH